MGMDRETGEGIWRIEEKIHTGTGTSSTGSG